jgi:uncharacterized RDD family membrane protein YckC
VFCSKCGTALTANSTFCGTCGTPVAPAIASPLAPVVVTPTAVAPYPTLGGVVLTRTPTYAGFWLRFVAHIIDSLILSPVFIGLMAMLFVMAGGMARFAELSRQRNPGDIDPAIFASLFSMFFVVGVVSLLISWLYYAYLESGEKQATWGKQVLGIYVTDLNGQRLTFGRATGRFFAKWVTGLIPLGIGYIMAGFTEKKQALHDMIVATLVLRH